jgi:hypothetical protein
MVGAFRLSGTKMEYLEHLGPNLDRIFHYWRESNTRHGV